MSDHAAFELWQYQVGVGDMVVASVSGPRDSAKTEIDHYALVYSQDGPVEIREVPY